MPSKRPQSRPVPEVRKGQGDMQISEQEFRERLRERFYDPKFETASAQVEQLIGIAWQVYSESHKSPRTRAAGEGFADPTMQLSVQWLATRHAMRPRNDQTCPGEMSKTYRLCSTARGVLSSVSDFTVDFLDLKAKELELNGWPYPRHLAGRAFSVVVHGDAAAAETLRGSLSDWLGDLQLVCAGPAANIGRYVGYYEPYATSHDVLDEDTAIHEEVRNAARALMGKVRELRGGARFDAASLEDPRPK